MTAYSQSMRAGATDVLLATVKKRATWFLARHLQGLDFLCRMDDGESLPSSDEVNMVLFRTVGMLLADRSVLYSYDLPGLKETSQTLGDIMTGISYVWDSCQRVVVPFEDASIFKRHINVDGPVADVLVSVTSTNIRCIQCRWGLSRLRTQEKTNMSRTR